MTTKKTNPTLPDDSKEALQKGSEEATHTGHLSLEGVHGRWRFRRMRTVSGRTGGRLWGQPFLSVWVTSTRVIGDGPRWGSTVQIRPAVGYCTGELYGGHPSSDLSPFGRGHWKRSWPSAAAIICRNGAAGLIGSLWKLLSVRRI